FEFGVRWGQNLALMESMRGLYEPYNYNRKIVGFDTFEGFPSVDEKDGDNPIIKEGSYNVTPNYESYLEQVLGCLEQENPIAHIPTTQLVKGDASETVQTYLKEHPETIVSMAYFDFDIYEPTRACLEAIKPHLVKGSVLGFDELNFHAFPGETRAFKEVFDLGACRLQRSPFGVLQSYMVME
ncbi:MAG: crotonobetainyl-CoA--carnitine CoA-transferase, partial [Verrucomicrobiota bacterium]